MMALLTTSGNAACGQAKKDTIVHARDTQAVSIADTIVTEKAEYHNAGKFGYVDIYIELPDGTDADSTK